MSNNHLKILAVTSVFVLIFSFSVFAGWSDHLPVPINSMANPGEVDPHSNSGGRRIVRINDTIIVICPHGSGERTYRSTNNGSSWAEIDTDGTFSGCLISGPEEMVYHFYRFGDHIYMVKFKYNETPTAPESIYTHPDLSETDTGVYRAVNATVDSEGVLYVATHWGGPDNLYVIRSSDNGVTWAGPYEISSGQGSWFYPHLEVTSENLLVCTYHKFLSGELWFAKSNDMGQTWTRVLLSNEETHNPSILTVGTQTIFVFAQSAEPVHKGLVYKFSNDSGATWSGWTLIDPTCGYADPSPGLGSDGRAIYVAYRSSNGTGVTSGTCGDQSRSRLVMSPDLGQTWQFVDNYYQAERTGTRYQIRYQTWWNYGGPLEWIWMQYENGGTNRPIYYDINMDADIFSDSEISTQFNLTVNIAGLGSVTTDPPGETYYAGTEVQLRAVPDEGWAFHGWSGDLSGYNNPAAIVLDADKTVTAIFNEDSDADGISDLEEDSGPNNGDGNYDGINDSDQLNVASFHTQDGTNYVTLESASGTTLSNCSSVNTPDEPGLPSNVTFPYDFFNFTVNGVGAGGTATATLYLPAGATPDTYYKYGPTPTNQTDHWYEFLYDSETGAEINNNVIPLHFVDGKRGDDDLDDTNGIIVDQGGPGFTTTPTPTPASGGGGGGGACFIATAAYGCYIEPHVRVLHEFRDRFLLTNAVGKLFIGRYYAYSPPVADFIANHDTLRALVRWSLLPFVGMAWMTINFGSISTLVFIILFLSLITLTRYFYLKNMSARE